MLAHETLVSQRAPWLTSEWVLTIHWISLSLSFPICVVEIFTQSQGLLSLFKKMCIKCLMHYLVQGCLETAQSLPFPPLCRSNTDYFLILSKLCQDEMKIKAKQRAQVWDSFCFLDGLCGHFRTRENPCFMFPINELVLELLAFFPVHKPLGRHLREVVSEDLRATLSKEKSWRGTFGVWTALYVLFM